MPLHHPGQRHAPGQNAINEIAASAFPARPRGRFAFKRCSTQSSANPGQPLARRAMTAPGAFWWPALGRVRAARALDPLPGAGGQGCAQPGVAGLLGPCCCCRAAGQPLAGCVPPCARSSSMHCPALVARAVLLPAVLVLLRVLVASTWPGRAPDPAGCASPECCRAGAFCYQ